MADSVQSPLKRKKIIAVLGMHRSGTSALARGLQALGLDLGGALLGPVENNNERGFFEDTEILAFNETLFGRLGSSWDRLSDTRPENLPQADFAALRRQARELLEKKAGGRNVFAFKDPRTAVLLPFWRIFFADAKLEDGYVLMLRNPLEVAQSLLARDGIPLTRGLLLWSKYMMSALKDTRRKPRLVVSYDALLTDAKAQLLRVSRILGFSPPADFKARAREFAKAFLEPELRHHSRSPDELRDVQAVPPFVRNLHSYLSGLSDDQTRENASGEPAAWRKLEAGYLEFVSLFRYVDLYDSRLDRLTRDNEAVRVQAAEAEERENRRYASLKTEAEGLRARSAALEKSKAELQARLQEVDAARQRMAAELQTERAQSGAQRRDLDKNLVELHATKALYLEERDRSERALRAAAQNENLYKQEKGRAEAALKTASGLEAALKEAKNREALLFHEKARSEAAAGAALKEVKDRQALLLHEKARNEAAAARTLTDLRVQIAALTEQGRLLRDEIEIHRSEYASLSLGYHTIIHTKSWKITAPLRKLKKSFETARGAWRRFLKKISLIRRRARNRPSGYDAEWALGQFSIQSAERFGELQTLNASIAVHAHVYYPDLIPEFAGYLSGIPYPFDLYVSVPNESVRKLSVEAFRAIPRLRQLHAQTTPNRGRDMGPFAVAFGRKLLQYDFVCHIHTKKSLYNAGASSGWREYLLDGLLGSEKRVRQILYKFASEPKTGLIYPVTYSKLPYQAHTWLANRAEGLAWCRKLGIREPDGEYFDFPAGSMFWARPQALAPLLGGAVGLYDFPEENGQQDGTLAHTFERLVGLAAISEGYNLVALHDGDKDRWSAWNFENYISRSRDSVLKAVKHPHIRMVVLDLFDTLLTRPLLNPETNKQIVARLAEEPLGASYLEWRATAEQRARAAAGRDVGLTEIYRSLSTLARLPEIQTESLMALEEKVEEASVSVREDVRELAEAVRTSGKRLVIASDTCLPRRIVEKMLSAAGVRNWDGLYISSETGLRKDSGRLYAHIVQTEGIPASATLIVGDNERSDWQIPYDTGFHALHVMSAVNFGSALPRIAPLIQAVRQNGSLDEEIALGLSIRKAYDRIAYADFSPRELFGNSPYSIGYSAAGPLVAAFVDWLVRRSLQDGVRTLYFLSREGLILKQAYDKWSRFFAGAPPSRYLVLSRRAATVAAISGVQDLEEIASVNFWPNTLKSFISNRFGIDLAEGDLRRISNAGLWPKNKLVEVKNKKISRLRPVLGFLYPAIQRRADAERRALLGYLEQAGLNAESPPGAVVDIGYAGTVQSKLEKLCGANIRGYYLMTTEGPAGKGSESRASFIGAAYHGLRPGRPGPVLFQNSFRLEKILSCNENQVECYQMEAAGPVARFKDRSEKELSSDAVREDLHRGILDYLDAAAEIKDSLFADFSPPLSLGVKIMESLIGRLGPGEKEILDRIALDDDYCGRGVVADE